MFYCEPCRLEKDWPESFVGSYGKCEVCGKMGDCHDVPSSQLPKREPTLGEKLKAMDANLSEIERLNPYWQIATLARHEFGRALIEAYRAGHLVIK